MTPKYRLMITITCLISVFFFGKWAWKVRPRYAIKQYITNRYFDCYQKAGKEKIYNCLVARQDPWNTDPEWEEGKGEAFCSPEEETLTRGEVSAAFQFTNYRLCLIKEKIRIN